MQMNVLTGLGGISHAPLGESMRRALRGSGTLPNRIRLRTEADQNLAEALFRSLNDKNARFTALTIASHESVALAAALGAVEDAMSAQWRLGGELQWVPIRLSMLQLTEFADEPMQLVSALARAIERQATTELVERLVTLLPDLKTDREFQRVTADAITGDELAIFLADKAFGPLGADIQPRLDSIEHALRAGLNLRPNRTTTQPEPWYMEEWKQETAQLMALMESHQEQSQKRIGTLESALDGVLALGSGLVAGLSLYPVLPPLAAVGSALMVGGLVTMLRLRRSHPKSDFDSPRQPVPERTRRQRVVRVASDTIEMGSQFSAYVAALRMSGLVPILVCEQASVLGLDDHASANWYRNLVAMMPQGTGAIFVCSDEMPFERVLEITHRYHIRPSMGELHRWLDQRLPLTPDLSSAAKARAELERATFRLAIIATGQGMPNLMERILQTRQIAGRAIPPAGLQDALVIRIRATFQLAAETVINAHRDEMVSDPILKSLLPVALGLVIKQWARGIPLKTDEAAIATYLDESSLDWHWVQLEDAVQQKVRSAISALVELLTSRAWLVNRLTESRRDCADLIPERALLVRMGELWAWSFSADGTPLFDIEPGIELTEPPQTGAPALVLSRPPRAVSQVTAIPEPLPQPTLEEVLEQYLGDYTPARRPSVGPTPESAVTQPPVHQQSQYSTMSTVEFFEALDHILVDNLGGALTIDELARIGLLPMVPTMEDVRRALIEDSSPVSLYVLYEAGLRLRIRLGIIEKFILWVTAVRTLCQSQPSVARVAKVIADSRGIRGRTAADQHTQLPLRELKAELRELCPNIRNNIQLFQRGAAPAGDAAGLQTWGAELVARSEALQRALRDGVSKDTVVRTAWDSFEYRLSTHVLDGAMPQPGVAELVSYIDGYGPAHKADWLHSAPSFGQLSRIYQFQKTGDEPTAYWSCCALASMALGLNRTGYEHLVGRPSLQELGGVLASRLEDAGTASRPLLLVKAHEDDHPIENGPAPSSGSALLVATGQTRYKKLAADLIMTLDSSSPQSRDEVHVSEADSVDHLIGWYRRYQRG